MTEARKITELVIPVGNIERWLLNVRLSGPFPLTVQEWNQFMHVLETMQPGLILPETKKSVEQES